MSDVAKELRESATKLEQNLKQHKQTSPAELAEAQRLTARRNAEVKAASTPNYQPGQTAPTPKQAAKGAHSFFGDIGSAIKTAATTIPGVGPAVGAVESGGSAVEGAVTGAVSGLAGEVASDVFKLLEEAFGATFVKALLYAVLAGGGAALIIAGVSRTAGLHPARAAKKVAGAAATGAVAA